MTKVNVKGTVQLLYQDLVLNNNLIPVETEYGIIHLKSIETDTEPTGWLVGWYRFRRIRRTS